MKQEDGERGASDNFDHGVDRARLLEQKRLEDTYLKVLSKVLDGMRHNYFFLKGLKVFVLAVQLVDSSSSLSGSSGLSALMKKKDG